MNDAEEYKALEAFILEEFNKPEWRLFFDSLVFPLEEMIEGEGCRDKEPKGQIDLHG